jgi:hypothetical protein
MRIVIQFDAHDPPTGTARTEDEDLGQLRFEGWLELVRVLSELLRQAPAG